MGSDLSEATKIPPTTGLKRNPDTSSGVIDNTYVITVVSEIARSTIIVPIFRFRTIATLWTA